MDPSARLIRELTSLEGMICRLHDGTAVGEIARARAPGPTAESDDVATVTATHAHIPHVLVRGGHPHAVWPVFRLHESPPHGGRRAGRVSYGLDSGDYVRKGGQWFVRSRRSVELCHHNLDGSPAVVPVHPAQQRLLADWLPRHDAVEPSEDDLEAVRQLKARYFRAMDCRDWDGFESVFAADAAFDIRGELMDTAGWCAMVRSFLRGGLSIHHGHTPELRTLDRDTIRGIWALTDYLEWPMPGARRAVRGYGHYEEEYRRDAAGWVISSLRLSYLRFDELPGPQVEAKALAHVDHGAWLDPEWALLAGGADDVAIIAQVRARLDVAASSTGEIVHSHTPEIRFRGHGEARAIWPQVRHSHLGGAADGYVDEYGYLHEEYLRRSDGGWEIAGSEWHSSRRDHMHSDTLIFAARR